MLKSTGFFKKLLLLLWLVLFFSCNLYRMDYMEPSKNIIDLNKFLQIEKLPLRFEKKLNNCNIIISLYTNINSDIIYEKIYKYFNDGIEILNEYLNFGQELFKKKPVKFILYLEYWQDNFVNSKSKFKKEEDKDFIIIRSFIFLIKDDVNWDEYLKSSISYFIHEFSHSYFINFQLKNKLRNKYVICWLEEGFAELTRYIFLKKVSYKNYEKMIDRFENIKNDMNLYQEVWEFRDWKLIKKHSNKILFMKITLRSNEKIRKYIYDFWKHYDDLYYLSFGIVLTMEEYYGKEKFKEILMKYRDGIEKEELKKLAEEAIKAKW